MARQTTQRGIPYYETPVDPPDGASQQADLANAIDARMVTGEQSATLPAIPPARRLQWHSGARTHFYSDGDQWWPVEGIARRSAISSGALLLTDANAAVDVAASVPVTLTIPPQSSVAWVDGAVIQILQLGSAAVTVAAGSGVTLRADGDRRTSTRRYVPMQLQRLGADEWLLADLGGNAAAARLGELATFAVAPGVEWSLADGRRVTPALGWTILRAALIADGNPYGSDSGDPLLPDARGRALIGAGQGTGGLSNRAAGAKVGSETHALQTQELPAHAHGAGDLAVGGLVQPRVSGVKSGAFNSYGTIDNYKAVDGWEEGVVRAVSGSTGNTGGGSAHNTMQPSLAVPTYIRVLP
jgi:microcystin-dependent protein